MATGTGLDAQVGYVAESAWGTSAVVTRFLPLISETMKKEIERVESPSIYVGRQTWNTDQWAPGMAMIGGDIQHELYDSSIGLLLRAAFGTVNTANASGTYTHTFWPAAPGVSLTVQIGRPTIYGTVVPFTYEGCKVQSWEIAAAAGENLTYGHTLVGEEETMGTALASASYTASIKPWRFQNATFSLAGSTTPISAFRIGGANNLVERRFVGATVTSEPLRENLAEYTGELTLEWGNPSAGGTLNYHRFFGGTEAALVMTAVAGGTASATITANIRYDGTTPNVAGRGIIEHSIPFKCIAGTLDSQAIQVQLVNGDSTA